MNKQIETERFIVRGFNENDGEDIKEYSIYKQSMGFETFNQWPNNSKGCKEVAKFFTQNYGQFWAVSRRSDNKVIGFITYNSVDEEKCLDLGHGFIPQYNQNEEAIEALRAMIQYAFDTMYIVTVDARNEKEWTEQVTPLLRLGFVELDDKMQMTKAQWIILQNEYNR